MKLIIGLGNPGKKYEGTRHNIGFDILDMLTGDFKFDKKFNAEISKEGEIIYIKPQTFMNLSGEAVQAVMSYYKIDLDDIIVIHDDLDIQAGQYKVQKNRSSAGHNGIKSIISSLGTQDFLRYRVGIRPNVCDANTPTKKFVVQPFSKNESENIEKTKKEVLEKIKQEN